MDLRPERRDVTPLPDLLHGLSRADPVRQQRPVYVDLLPPCNAGCPAGENIQAWLAHAEAGNHERAWRQLVEGELAVMAERAMADVVREAGRIDQIGVAAQLATQLPADLRAFERVSQPGAREVGRACRDDLGLGRQPAQRGAVQHAGTVPLEVAAPGPLGWLGHPAGRGAFVVLAPHLLSEPPPASAARPASRRAIGTRNGEQDT